jgi:hypothetical protein
MPPRCPQPCQPGACQPVALASDLRGPRGIALDATSVYFTSMDADTVMKVSKAGGPPVVIAPRRFPSEQPFGVAVAGGSVFWTAYFRSYVGRVGLDGQDLTTLVEQQTYPTWIVANESRVYWVATGASRRSNHDGTGLAPFTTDRVRDLAVDAKHLYWTRDLPGGAIVEADLDGGNPVPLAALVNPGALALDEANVYVADEGRVVKVSRSGGALVTVASGQNPSGIAADASGVYWTNHADGSIRKAQRDGSVTTLATGQRGPTRILLDECSIYWLDEEAAAIMKLAR